MTTAAQLKAKRQRRPIYMTVRKLVDPETGEEIGALVPSNPIDRRLMKERRYHVGREVRAELKAPRNAAFHRLAHAIGHLLVDNVEAFRHLSAHQALKQVQRESGVCCDPLEIDLGALGKVPVNQSRSLSFDEMEEDEFGEFFRGITDYIDQHYASAMTDDVREEYALMVEADR